MSDVVIRCPNCGTTQGTLGECEACHEAETRYFCTNHEPGVWLEGPECSGCGARFGRDRVADRPPPPPPRRRGRVTPSGRRRPPPREREPVIEDPWRAPARVPRSVEVESVRGPGAGGGWRFPAEPPPVDVRVVTASGCVRRLVMLVLILLVLAALAFFGLLGIGAEIFFGAGSDAAVRGLAAVSSGFADIARGSS